MNGKFNGFEFSWTPLFGKMQLRLMLPFLKKMVTQNNFFTFSVKETWCLATLHALKLIFIGVLERC